MLLGSTVQAIWFMKDTVVSSLQGQNNATHSQVDGIVVIYALKNPHSQPHRLIDRGNGVCWPEWGKEEEGCSAQPTAPEREHARTNGRRRRVPSTRKPPCRDSQPDPSTGARELGKRGGEEEEVGCTGHSARMKKRADKRS